jgi:hypothetical protein
VVFNFDLVLGGKKSVTFESVVHHPDLVWILGSKYCAAGMPGRNQQMNFQIFHSKG